MTSLAKKEPKFCLKYHCEGMRAWIGVIVLLVSIAWVTIVCTSLPALAEARNYLATEQMVGDALQSPKPSQVDTAQEGTAGLIVLPKFGYGPEGGPAIGIKFTGRHLGDTGLTLDLNTVTAWEGQQSYHFNAVHAKFFDGRLISVLNANFFSDPTREFFGLGNNNVGPDPLSTHRLQRVGGELTLAWRLFDRLAVAISVGYEDVQVGRGEADTERDLPFTVDVFPDLNGIEGGHTIPLSLSLIFNNQQDITRPTRGWSVIAEVERVDRALGSDYTYTRLSADASYLWPLLTLRQLLALRLDGEHFIGDLDDVPFYNLTYLGGDDTLRGFFSERFLGTSRVLATFEYRLKLLDFQFFNLWEVRIDGVGFVETGRVFIDGDDVAGPFLRRLVKDWQLSYGVGVRMALGQAILARIDVGFSEEESALIYLSFNHPF
jgi:outer membrane protein assembly factor BamA